MNIVVDVSARLVETLTITVLAREGSSMAPRRVTKAAAPAKSKAAAKKAAPPKAATKKTAATAESSKPPTSRSPLPSATIRALEEVEAGKLTRYADADDLFQKLGIKLGEE